MASGPYQRLRPRQRAIARRSDASPRVPLPAERLPGLRRLAAAMEAPLRADDRVVLERRAGRFVMALLAALRLPPVGVRIHASRPRQAGSELHGLYVREPGKRPLIHVWMRTAVQQRPVRYRTFLRTLLHEVCHHLDYEWLRLPDSLHTKGFYQRESSLVRQLSPPAGAARPAAKPTVRRPRAASAPPAEAGAAGAEQLRLFD